MSINTNSNPPAETLPRSTVISQCKSFLHYGIWRCYNKAIETYPPPYALEFKHAQQNVLATNSHVTAYQEKALLAYNRMTSPSKFWGLAASGTTIFILGAVEAFLLLSPRKKYNSPSFIFTYARQQMFSSIIWATKPAEMILKSMGKRPSEYLNCKISSSTQLRILGLQTARSTFAGFLGISQIFAMAFAFSDATEEYEDKLMKGKIPFQDATEKIIRMSGKSSDVSDYTIDRFGIYNFLLIYENPELLQNILRDHSDDKVVPCFWNIPNSRYGNPSSWGASESSLVNKNRNALKDAKFQIQKEWLSELYGDDDENNFNNNVKTARHQQMNKNRILIVEADSSVGEEALAFTQENNNDLDVAEVSLGFRMIERLAKAQNVMGKDDKIMRILLADESNEIVSGGGKRINIREHVVENNVVDVLIDAKKPLLKSIIVWAIEASKKMGKPNNKVLYFDTTNEQYFQSVKHALAKYGWKVLDGQSSSKDFICKEKYSLAPCLVYQDSTTRTVDSIRHLVQSQNVPAENICALLDKHIGQKELDFLEKELGANNGYGGASSGIGFVCSSQIYDLLFQTTRLLLKANVSPTEIQELLDKELEFHESNTL